MKGRDRVGVCGKAKAERNLCTSGHSRYYSTRKVTSQVWRSAMSYEEALRVASRDERFMATVYAMNTLLIHKGIYSHEEFQQLFTEWVRKEEKKKSEVTIPHAHAYGR